MLNTFLAIACLAILFLGFLKGIFDITGYLLEKRFNLRQEIQKEHDQLVRVRVTIEEIQSSHNVTMKHTIENINKQLIKLRKEHQSLCYGNPGLKILTMYRSMRRFSKKNKIECL